MVFSQFVWVEVLFVKKILANLAQENKTYFNVYQKVLNIPAVVSVSRDHTRSSQTIQIYGLIEEIQKANYVMETRKIHLLIEYEILIEYESILKNNYIETPFISN